MLALSQMSMYVCIYICVDICAYIYVLTLSQIFKTLLVTADKITFKVTYHKVHD